MDYNELLESQGVTDFYVIDDAVIECPCGYNIEWDGRCPDGCVSPMLTLGLI